MLLISFIGEPCTGKGTLAKLVCAKLLEHRRTVVVSISSIIKKIATPKEMDEMKHGGLYSNETNLRAALLYTVETIDASGGEIVLLDGFPRFDDQLKWQRQTLWDHQQQIFRIMARDDHELFRRAAARGRDEFDTGEKFIARLQTQRQLLSGVEKLAFDYSLPYISVINDYQDRAVLEVISRIKPPKREKVPNGISRAEKFVTNQVDSDK